MCFCMVHTGSKRFMWAYADFPLITHTHYSFISLCVSVCPCVLRQLLNLFNCLLVSDSVTQFVCLSVYLSIIQ